jgi:very-short-patch-repair endonuclease
MLAPMGVGGEVPNFPITRRQPVTRSKLELAKQLRKAMMPEERMLWSALRRNAIANLHFRRQQVIAGFIADFYCAAARLVVEIDGGSHLMRKEYDSRRDKVFSELGIRTLRLSSESVARGLAGVLRLIEGEATRPASRP